MSFDKTKFVNTYFERLTASDIEGIIAMFENDAKVTSPFLGVMGVRPFFEKLRDASAQSKLTVFDILFGAEQPSAAAHFRYQWTLADGSELDFSGIDLFQFSPAGKFQSLSIFYDTHPLRLDVGDKYA